jgi:hypothetical protein
LEVRFGIRAALLPETDMDGSITVRPRPGAPPRSHALRDPVTVREATDTELDPANAVAPADGERHGNNNPHDEPARHDVIIDPQGREALFNAVDVRTAQVGQSPNQALMRERAYRQPPPGKEPPAAEPDAGRDPHADIEA